MFVVCILVWVFLLFEDTEYNLSNLFSLFIEIVYVTNAINTILYANETQF